jgi:LysM repeat protein
MLRNFLSIILFCFISCPVFAQNDSLFVTDIHGDWQILHIVQSGETVFSVARKYHVPPAMLADANKTSYNAPLPVHQRINVPVGAYNKMPRQPQNNDESRPLYYRVQDESDLGRISKFAGVSQRTLQDWNHLSNNELTPGQRLLVGWIMYDATQLPVATTPASTNVSKTIKNEPLPVPVKPVPQTVEPTIMQEGIRDTAARDTLKVSVAAQMYNEQTNDGSSATTEKGSLVFFAAQSKSKAEPYFAFFNNAPKGTIIKVHNLSNDHIVYVKVLGPLPQTKMYYNALIGVSSYARVALGAPENKVWCELNYSPVH